MGLCDGVARGGSMTSPLGVNTRWPDSRCVVRTIPDITSELVSRLGVTSFVCMSTVGSSCNVT